MNDQSHELVDFMRAISRQIADEYIRIRKRTTEDPSTAGDQGEENWATLLRDWLPPSYQIVTKGRILSHRGTASPQVDVLVLAPTYPRHLMDKKLYLAGGILAAFECKTTLRAAHLEAAIQTAVAIRGQLPLRFGTPYRELFSPIYYGVLAHSHDWASPSEEVGDKVLTLLSRHDVSYVTHPREMLDVVCVADLGVWLLQKTSWRGPKTVNKGEATAEEFYRTVMEATFGPEGCATTQYVRSVVPSATAVTDPRFTPIGAALSSMLRRLAWEDPTLRPIASYFRETHMEGGGPGYLRKWSRDVYSAALQQDVIDGTHVPSVSARKPWDAGDLWDEWALDFM